MVFKRRQYWIISAVKVHIYHEHHHRIKANDKRVLRICRKKGIKYSNNGCTRQAVNPQFIADNILNRDFTAEAQNQKLFTDVTEFKRYDENKNRHKVYLNTILDLYDRQIVTYVISEHNDNPLIFNMFDKVIAADPGATPLYHSDRGFQYTNQNFHAKLEATGMIQSMSK